MPKFIKITDSYGDVHFINVDQITDIKGSMDATRIYLTSNNDKDDGSHIIFTSTRADSIVAAIIKL